LPFHKREGTPFFIRFLARSEESGLESARNTTGRRGEMLGQLHYWPRTWIETGCLAFAISALSMPIAIWFLRRFGVIDKVSNEKLHALPVPRGGGVVMFVAFAVAALRPHYFSTPMKGVMIGAFVCLLVGAIDDLRGGIPAVWQFLTLAIVTAVLSRYGVVLKLAGYYPVDFALTLLWIVGVTSAFNALDNMDGLASGTAIIVAVMYLVIAVQAYLRAGTETSLSWFGMMAAALIGANLGFLLFNFRPARIFMGDSGSFFLGFILSALGVMGEWSEHRISSTAIPVLILGVPVFDFAYILVARVLRGETRTIRQVIEHCALDHLSHRLMWIGFSQRKAVLFIYLIAFVLGVSGILLSNSRSALDTALALAQGLSVVVIVVVLMATAERRHLEAVRTEVRKFRSTRSDDAPEA